MYSLIIFFLLLVSSLISAKPSADLAVKIQKIDRAFVHLCQTNQFSGAALIAINGNVRFKKACGLANRDFEVPNTVNTKFNLGSVGKLFTSVAIAQLLATQKVRFDSKIAEFLPSWLKMPHGEAIRIEHLLTHSSGLGNFMDDKRWQLGADSGLYRQTKDYRPLIMTKALAFKPGASQLYSNSAYVLLGAVFEKLSQQSYSDYLQQHLFSLAKMSDTGIYSLDTVVKNRAVGYFYHCPKKTKQCRWLNNNFAAPFMGTAAGGAYSTVEDLFKFSQFLFSKDLLSIKLREELISTTLFQPHDPVHVKSVKIGALDIPAHFSAYGFAGAWNKLGFAVWQHPLLIGHTGGTKGAAALLLNSPDNQYSIIILSNLDNGTTLFYQKIRQALGFKGAIENF